VKKIMSFDEINALAKDFAEKARPGDVIVLEGELGTGKTAFARAFAKGLGVRGSVKSPTFNYVLEYRDGRLPLYHFDCYRIADPAEIFEIGYDEYVGGDGVALLEWGERIADYLPEAFTRIRFCYVPEDGAAGGAANEEKRIVEIRFTGKKEGEEHC
jgi:tRNA threonylcarbamoyladenosine biosynthesis protein TsaE